MSRREHDPNHRPRFPVVAGVTLGLVALVVVTVLVGTRLQGDTKSPPSSRQTASPAASSVGPACPTDTSTALPQSAPPSGVSWKPLSDEFQILLPTSSRYGPCRITSTTGSGFAHTPSGALVASANILTRSGIPGSMADRTIADQVVDGPWKKKFAENIASTSGDSSARPIISAYAIVSYTPTAVDVSLALTYPNQPEYRVYKIGLQWQDGDWRMVAPINGDWNNSVSGQATLNGFVAWGPSD
jgi:hypothetical protein